MGFLTDSEEFYIFTLLDGTTREGQYSRDDSTFLTTAEPIVIGIKSFPARRTVYIPWRSIASYKKLDRKVDG